MEYPVQILECTLRDGSYQIDYQFTGNDTYILCLCFAEAGVKWIEVGHGMGMSASTSGHGTAAATDIEYLQAARAGVGTYNTKFGMFFIPGIGQMKDIETAAKYSMNFIRIGTDTTQLEKAKPFIKKAKEYGMTVFSNLMKSYAVSPDELAVSVKKADEYGADIICVVDSAGCMLPEEVRNYISAAKKVTDKPIGFHGHNNLDLAMANALEAIKSGASIIDSCLHGMGRSAGNVQTEILLLILEKLKYHSGIDIRKIVEAGKRIIKPKLPQHIGIDDIDFISGYASFHSGYLEMISEVAEQYGEDKRRLILEVGDVEKFALSRELVEKVAKQISEKTKNEKLSTPSA